MQGVATVAVVTDAFEQNPYYHADDRDLFDALEDRCHHAGCFT
jgi:hypothetical protein